MYLPRAISDPRTQNSVSYTVYILTTILYTIYFILSDVVSVKPPFCFNCACVVLLAHAQAKLLAS